MAAGIKIGEAFVEVTADSKGAFKGVDREASASGARSGKLFGDNFGAGLGKLGGVIAGVVAVDKVTTFFSGAVKGASDLNEEASKSGVVFGTAAADIEAWAATSAKSVGLSKQAALQATGTFGNMFTQLGYSSKEAANMSTDVVQLAADLGSFNNLPTATVADMMSASFRGEYDSLQALIPNINAARVEQEAMAATGKTSAKELTAQEKAAATLAIIHKDGAKAQGDFARTSDGLANSTKIATADFENMQASLGTKLLPIATNVMSFFRTDGIPALQGLGDIVMNNVVPAISGFVGWLKDASPWLIPLATGVGVIAAGLGIASIALGIYNTMQAAMAATGAAATLSALGLNAALLANPITWIVVGIVALVAALVWVATQTTFFQDAWNVMSTAIGTAWNWLWTTVLQPVFNFIGQAITNVGLAATALWTVFIQPAINAIGAIFNWLWNSIISPVITVITAALVLFGYGVSLLWGAYVQPAIAAIGDIFNWLWTAVISPVVGWVAGAMSTIGSVIMSLWTGFVQPAITAVGDAFNWVWNSVISPVANWIGGRIQDLSNTVGGIFQGMASTMQNAFNGVAGVVKGVINGVISMVNGGIGGINGFIDLANKVPGVSLPYLGNIPYLATGGTIKSTGVAMVGEKGPELVTLPRGATVHPNGTGPGISEPSGAKTSSVQLIVNGNINSPVDVDMVMQKMTFATRRM